MARKQKSVGDDGNMVVCLALSPDEVDNVEGLRQLTAEQQRSLILSIKNTQGCILKAYY